jgi:hypothetical protein
MGIGMWLAGFATATLGTAVVLSGVVASLAGLFLVRRAVPHAVLKQHNDVVGIRARGRGCRIRRPPGFNYLYGLESASIHAVIVASLSGLICFCLFLLWSLAFPFTGGTAIQSQPFQQFIVDK